MESKTYLYSRKEQLLMDIDLRKYNFIQKLITIQNEKAMDILEQTLDKVIENNYQISEENLNLLNERLEIYLNNPDDLMDWETSSKD
ncbi:hypothetical protein [Flagellimonas algicola]|uniref:Uncharacterized protein n=1 Tax=Flagellimonas algicola TaxID=2583815 RepID=A0ABY2WNW7_9FLAO|nr:hypothetical protein [Allomuricauda algicola]TMU56683.1 hypothetical protein FGG15_03830 [Allomuricauda algicola]